jgi:hypothetical protein
MHVAVFVTSLWHVDVMMLAPGGSYRLTTDTSVAAAHVGGAAARS